MDDEKCEICGEGDDPYEDVVANFVDDANEMHLAHVECGETSGWRLA